VDVTSEEQVETGIAKVIKTFGRLDIRVSNAGIQIVAPLDEFRQMEAAARHPSRRRFSHHARGAQADVQAKRRKHHLYGLGAFEGSLGAQGTLCHGQARPHRSRQDRRQGRRQAGRSRQRHLPGFVRTPLVDKQIPEQAKELGISEQDVLSRESRRATQLVGLMRPSATYPIETSIAS
jgi:3-hydroxybutyrate dehydrogenase